MSLINRPPIGLQGLLGSKNFGNNPSDLAQQVVPTVDLFTFWGSQVLKFAQEAVTTSGIGSLAELTVPEGKTWGIVSAAWTQVPEQSTDNINLAIALDDGLAGTVYYIVAAMEAPITASQASIQENSVTWNPSHIFWLPPGYVIRGIQQGQNASTDFRLDAVYYELDV